MVNVRKAHFPNTNQKPEKNYQSARIEQNGFRESCCRPRIVDRLIEMPTPYFPIFNLRFKKYENEIPRDWRNSVQWFNLVSASSQSQI